MAVYTRTAARDGVEGTNARLADANADGWRAHSMVKHNGLLVFMLGPDDQAEQKVLTMPPDEQFERPINERLTVEHAEGWSVLATESHNGFLVFLMGRTPITPILSDDE